VKVLRKFCKEKNRSSESGKKIRIDFVVLLFWRLRFSLSLSFLLSLSPSRNMAAPSTSPALLYRQTALGDALVESLDALITEGKIAPDLALKVLAEVR
jgi:hypothetical protein